MERKNLLKFTGDGAALFGITIVNTILTVITLGLYYPWAKVKYLQYYYENTYLSGSHFTFHGKGDQIFKGFIKAIIFIIAIVALMFIFFKIDIPFLGFLIYFAGIIVLMPIAMHGTFRYRLAKTSWRSIYFGYRGNITDLIKLFVKGFLLTMVTLGIYGAWFEVDLKKYTYKHIRFGNSRLNFTGEGKDLFIIHLVGFLLTIVTLGIYSFWYAAKLFRYNMNNTKIEHNGELHSVKSEVDGFDVFVLYLVNGLITVFTLGLGFPWARVREMKFFAENIIIPEEFDTDNLIQTEEDYDDATGDSALDFLDFDIIF